MREAVYLLVLSPRQYSAEGGLQPAEAAHAVTGTIGTNAKEIDATSDRFFKERGADSKSIQCLGSNCPVYGPLSSKQWKTCRPER